MKNKKLWIVVAVIAIIAAIALAFSPRHSAENPDNKPVIKIGAILPLSGDLANVGESAKNAIMMAVANANKNADNRYYYKLVVDDDRFEVKKTVVLANKQIFSNAVAAIVGFASTPGLVVAPIADKHKVIYMNVGASDQNIAKGGYAFIHWTMPSQTTGRLAEFFARKGYKNIAIISEVDAGFSVLEKALAGAAKNAGIKTKTFEINPTEKDFRPVLAQIKQMKPDALVVGVWGAQLPILIKQYHESGLTMPIANTETFSMAPDFSILEGAYFSDVAQSPEEFNARLRGEYKSTASDFATGNFYDAIMLMVKAFETAETPEEAAAALRAIKEYDGIVGRLTQSDNGIFQSDAVIKRVTNGKPEIVEE
ncbi:MAG: ABC transporter substrate-binding protein [Alphaproteobacteria bacterium]|nr:ABC transporter substrate-binding protein [Alphaproteobacteria bacterium]